MNRKSIQFTTLIALFALVFVSCQMNKPVDESKIDEVNEKFMQAFTDGDAEAVTALYSSDAVLLPPFGDAISTKQDITDLWNGMMDIGITGVELVSNEIIPAGDMAVERGEYTIFVGDMDIDHGKFLVLWKMENGQWKLHRDIWNSSLPAEGTDDNADEGSDEGTE